MAVKDRGDSNAQVLVIGEAPGFEEEQAGYPFVGRSGRKLNDWLYAAGIDRKAVYVTNVMDTIPPTAGGNLDEAIRRGVISRAYIESRYIRLHRLVTSLPYLRAVVTVGNYSTYGMCQRGRVPWDKGQPGITSVRGSLYEYTVPGTERRIPLVPTIHPAAVLRQATWERRCVADWLRIASVIQHGMPKPPERHFCVRPTFAEVKDWFANIVPGRDCLAIDIESWGNRLQMVGFAKNTKEAIVIPTVNSYWGNFEHVDQVWNILRPILANPNIDKIMQNGLFDCWWLSKYAEVKGYHWDTMGMHHALEPLEPHSLHYMASIYCDWYEYWKDEAKSAAEIVRIADKEGLDRLYVYNGLDCTNTFELFEVFYDLLHQNQRLPFYLKHYADMHEPLLRLSRRGALVDREMVKVLYDQNYKEAQRYRDKACQLAKRPLFKFSSTKCERAMLDLYQDIVIDSQAEFVYDEVKTAIKVQGKFTEKQIEAKYEQLNDKMISDQELAKTLFKEWNAPQGKKTEKTYKDKLDDVNLRVLQNKCRDRQRGLPHKLDIMEMVDLVRQHRRARKLASFLQEKRIDADDCIHSEYRYVTRSGRLSSRENPEGTGANLQNYDHTLKRIFVARPGRILIEVDLSRAESRVVKVLTGDEEMIRQARLAPTEGDEHKENAAVIFSAIYGRELTLADIDYDMRQIGKRVVHATNYKMGKNRLVEVLLKEGFVVTVNEAGKMIEAYEQRVPALATYHRMVRRHILQDQILYTSWGRQVHFRGYTKDDELYKFGYSFTPQSEVGDLTNQYGVIHIDRLIQENKMDSFLIAQDHDAITVDTPVDEAYTIIESLSTSLSQPRHYGNCFGLDIELSIPCEVSIGLSRDTTHGWAYIPSEAEVKTAIDDMFHYEKVGV